MRTLQPVLFINLSLIIIIYLLLGGILELHYLLPPFYIAFATINLALAGIFMFSGDRDFALSFLLGAILCAAAAGGMNYYTVNYLPEPWELIH